MRRKTQFVQGGYYHIYNRGAARQPIFRNDADYTSALQLIKTYCNRLSITVIAYCLMPNHYHWLVRQDGDIPTRLLPQRVFNTYTKRFNSRHDRSGTLFEGPYKAIQVDRDEYLRHLCRYIHANPLKDGIAFDLEMWPYSNIHEWLGTRNGKLFDDQFMNEHFPDRGRYRSWVLGYVSTQQLPDSLVAHLGELERI
jgi:putative transposase